MKKTNIVKTLIAIAAVAAINSVNAADSVSGNVKAGYSNENFYRGADLGNETLNVSANVKGSVSGVSVFGGVTTAQAINAGADQYYINAGVASSLFEDSLDVTGGYLHSESVSGDAIGELFATATGNVLLSPTLAAYYELDDQLWTFELGVKHELDLEVVGLCLHASVGDTEITSSTDRTYYTVGANVTRGLTDDVDLIASVDRIDADDSDDETVFAVGINVKF